MTEPEARSSWGRSSQGQSGIDPGQPRGSAKVDFRSTHVDLAGSVQNKSGMREAMYGVKRTIVLYRSAKIGVERMENRKATHTRHFDLMRSKRQRQRERRERCYEGEDSDGLCARRKTLRGVRRRQADVD
jgi:hypothetical protein